MAIDKERLKIRLETEHRIYEDSPNVNVTYKDLARFVELFEEVIGSDPKIGFHNEKDRP